MSPSRSRQAPTVAAPGPPCPPAAPQEPEHPPVQPVPQQPAAVKGPAVPEKQPVEEWETVPTSLTTSSAVWERKETKKKRRKGANRGAEVAFNDTPEVGHPQDGTDIWPRAKVGYPSIRYPIYTYLSWCNTH